MFDHILVPMDGSSLAECVLPHAMAIARVCESQVTLLRVLERTQARDATQSIDPLDWHIRRAEAEAHLNELSTRLQKAGLRTENALLEGQAAERIIEFSHSHAVSLVILSSHGRSGLSGWNVSSIVQKVILRVRTPLMIVRAYQPIASDLADLRYRRLLVPLDCSQRAECALPLATTLARFHEAELLLLHVVSKPEMVQRAPLTHKDTALADQLTERNRLAATRYLENLGARLSPNIQSRVLISDNAAAALHDMVEQEKADLVVLSAHGYSGRTKWPYGSMAVNFIAYGTTPLLIVQDLPPGKMEYTRAEIAAREHKGH
ncbi:MAG: universal stress protein [Chloroflexota bacterium]|nr:universal stress protein [Chloroflexota bacterium]